VRRNWEAKKTRTRSETFHDGELQKEVGKKGKEKKRGGESWWVGP